MGIFWTAWIWQSWIGETSSTILLAQNHFLFRKDLNQGRERLISDGMRTYSWPKEPHRRWEAIIQPWAGQRHRDATTRISTYNWLTTALWHPSGEKWKAEDGQGDISHFQLASWSCPLLAFLSCTFLSGFQWAEWSFFHYVSCEITVQVNGVLLGKGLLTYSLTSSLPSFTYSFIFPLN